jgi:hypothetical protein
MQTTIDRLQEKGYPVRVVNVEREQRLAQKFNARFLPTFVLVHRGEEVARHEGATSFDRLAGMFEKLDDSTRASRTGAGPRTEPQDSVTAVRGQSPASIIPSLKVPGLNRPEARPAPPSAADRPHMIDRAPDSLTDASTSANANSSLTPEQRAFQATVRIKVIDRGGHSFGTGTIVDQHDGYALVITCGHLFREVGKKGQVEVELFAGSAQPRTVPGRVITFDADERDIALVEIQPGVPVQAAPVAGNVNVVRRGADVFSIGCNQGDDPTIARSRISAIDKYIGFPNIEVSGQPVVGRSGGGLFTAAGHLIGICNAADSEDDEGIYAGLPMIHEELDSVGIDPTKNTPNSTLVNHDGGDHNGDEHIHNATMPRDDRRQEESSTGGRPAAHNGNDLLSNVANQHLPAGVSQLICIVRTQDNPQGELVVIDNPTPELLAKLRPSEPRVAANGESWRPIRKPNVE